VNLKLYGVDLPWVRIAAHLGHELSEDCNMGQDMKVKMADFVSMRSSILACFWKFFQGVKTSSSLEVRVVANLASMDIRAATGSNLFGIRKLCKQDIIGKSMAQVKLLILEAKSTVPELDGWGLGCLKKYLEDRYLLLAKLEDTTDIDALIDSLCFS
jgi:hypothetical protein